MKKTHAERGVENQLMLIEMTVIVARGGGKVCIWMTKGVGVHVAEIFLDDGRDTALCSRPEPDTYSPGAGFLHDIPTTTRGVEGGTERVLLPRVGTTTLIRVDIGVAVGRHDASGKT